MHVKLNIKCGRLIAEFTNLVHLKMRIFNELTLA